MRATCLAHLVLLYLITLIILLKRTSYEDLHYAVFPSLLPLPLSEAPVYKHLSLLVRSSLSVTDQVSDRTKQQAELWLYIF